MTDDLKARLDSEEAGMMLVESGFGECAACAHRRYWCPRMDDGGRWLMSYCGYLAARGYPQPDEMNFTPKHPCKLFKERGPDWDPDEASDYVDSWDDTPKGVAMLTIGEMEEDEDFIPTGNE